PFPRTPEYPEFAKVTNSSITGPLVAGDTTRVFFALVNTDGSPTVLDKPTTQAVQLGEIKIYIFGYIHYTDAYTYGLLKHKTGFCYRYDPESDISVGLFVHCDEAAYAYGD